jgi:putative redox protein
MSDLVVSFPGGLRVDAQVGDFVVHTDQPAEGGGDGSAPTPFSVFLASLGTCAGIYVLGYLKARGLPTEGLQILQDHERDAASGLIGKVRMAIHLPAGIGQEHHAAIVRSAQKCAVKKHLEHPPAFDISIG